MLHEIGHALGLKHPFEADRDNKSVLNPYEDHTKFTAMSYDEDPNTFDGTFRSLDWMSLTKLYGVNPDFNSSDDVYKFNSDFGVFIIDGAGNDKIDASFSVNDINIDLRSGMHSHEGIKSTYITSAYQLTISHGSNIEDVETGSGNDVIVGNSLPNTIISGAGNDTICGGEGSDLVYPGSGRNVVDFSEDINS